MNTAAPAKSLPWRAISRLRTSGPLATLRRVGFLCYEAYREWRLGIDTAGFIPWNCLGADAACVDYDPIGYLTLDRALRCLQIDSQQGVFLDYGCGKGRVVTRAAQLPFRRVIGVEMSEPLYEAAQENIAHAKQRLRCSEVQIININAKQYTVPDDVSVVFLFNPFTGHILDAVIDNLRQSFDRSPRQMTVLYVLPVQSKDHVGQEPWLIKQHEQFSQGLRLVVYRSTHFSNLEASA